MDFQCPVTIYCIYMTVYFMHNKRDTYLQLCFPRGFFCLGFLIIFCILPYFPYAYCISHSFDPTGRCIILTACTSTVMQTLLLRVKFIVSIRHVTASIHKGKTLAQATVIVPFICIYLARTHQWCNFTSIWKITFNIALLYFSQQAIK